jgi:DNA-binding NarL/FixJ family response regulator
MKHQDSALHGNVEHSATLAVQAATGSTQSSAADEQCSEELPLTVRFPSGIDTGTGVALIDTHPFTRECIVRCLQESLPDSEVSSFGAVAECVASPTNRFACLLYHLHGPDLSEDSVCEDLASLQRSFGPVPVIVLSAGEDSDAVLSVLQSGARGYIPTTATSLRVAVEVIRLVKAGGTFFPSSCLMSHSPNGRREPATAVLEERLTPRQMAVLQYLKRGKANKSIAYALDMSESTVKVHVRNIMKKMGATNRTEAVLRATRIIASRQWVASP